MNCPKCNAQNDDNAEVCMICGEPLDTDEMQTPEDKNAKLEEIQQKRAKKQRNKKIKKAVITCVFLAVVLGAAGYGINEFIKNAGPKTQVIPPSTSATATVSPSAEPEASASATPEITEEPTASPAATEEAVITPQPTSAVTPVTTAKPVKKPAATKKPVSSAPVAPSAAPVVSSPGFTAGSSVQTPVAQGEPIKSTLITVTSVETAEYSGRKVASFTIGNESYYAYADDIDVSKGLPAMYSVDARATRDEYYGRPVYRFRSIEAYNADDYILPRSSTVNLTEADLAGLSKTQLNLARNEIFARHGRTFKRQEIQNYFETKSWYKVNPSYNYTNDYVNLSELELRNAKFILAYENR